MYYLYAYDTVESGIKQLNWIDTSCSIIIIHNQHLMHYFLASSQAALSHSDSSCFFLITTLTWLVTSTTEFNVYISHSESESDFCPIREANHLK